MTEHILNFAIGIDDDAIIKNIQENAHKQIIQDIKKDIISKIFDRGYWNIGIFDDSGRVSDSARLNNFAENIVREAISEYKDAIIEKAAELLVDSYRRTKAWKERAAEEIDNANSGNNRYEGGETG